MTQIEESKKKRRIPVSTVIALLLMAVLLTTGITFSRYMSSASGSDSAQVASFDVTENGVNSADIPLGDMEPGSVKTYTFHVTNASEVSVSCLVDVKTTGNLPLTFTVTEPDGTTVHTLTPGKPVTLAAIPYSQTAATEYTLTITWPATQNDAKYAGLLDAVKLSVTAQQVD